MVGEQTELVQTEVGGLDEAQEVVVGFTLHLAEFDCVLGANLVHVVDQKLEVSINSCVCPTKYELYLVPYCSYH